MEDQTSADSGQSSTTLNSPPPLTPINTLKASNVATNILPKLQRIPRNSQDGEPPIIEQQIESVNASPPTLEPQLPPPLRRPSTADLYPPPPPPPTVESSKSLVGAVTTWLPHNSKIVSEPTEAPRPQYLEVLNGRKFLVIPKHNFMSVSPTVAATASSRRQSINEQQTQEVPTASLGLNNVDNEMKIDPESPSKPENSQTQNAQQLIDNEKIDQNEHKENQQDENFMKE